VGAQARGADDKPHGFAGLGHAVGPRLDRGVRLARCRARASAAAFATHFARSNRGRKAASMASLVALASQKDAPSSCARQRFASLRSGVPCRSPGPGTLVGPPCSRWSPGAGPRARRALFRSTAAEANKIALFIARRFPPQPGTSLKVRLRRPQAALSAAPTEPVRQLRLVGLVDAGFHNAGPWLARSQSARRREA